MTGDGLVQVAYLHRYEVSTSWHESLMRLVTYDAAHNRRIRWSPIGLPCPSGALADTRNTAVGRWLDETPHEWLWMIDTDMGFAPDTVDRLVDAADPSERPVVGGLCFAVREVGPDGMGGRRVALSPTMYVGGVDPETGARAFVTRWRFPADSLVAVDGTGAACLLVHRAAAEKVRATFGDEWFTRVRYADPDRRLVSEDLSFCAKLRGLDVPVYVHTGVTTTHHKMIWFGPEDYTPPEDAPPTEAYDAASVQPKRGQLTADTAVVVPVLRRPQNAAPFMESLKASTTHATVYAVADVDDRETADAWKAAGAIVLVMAAAGDKPGTFAEKVNIGYRHSQAPWLFLVGDDVRFHPGWLEQAQAAAGDQYHVVGTNDRGSPRVRRGEHATHVLVRRSYVDEMGASWDGPKIVAHEGYRHWFVDDEIVTAAKARGVWTFATASVVEHMHPYFGRGEMDDVYRLGESAAQRDRELFEKRKAEYL